MSDLGFIDEERLGEWVNAQRWFGSKARDVTGLHVMHALELCSGPPRLVIALIEARFQAGTHVVYQLPIGLRPRDEGWDQGVIAETGEWTVYDALVDPDLGHQLFTLIRDGHNVTEDDAHAEFRSVDLPQGEDLPVRPVGAGQSNSSIVYAGGLVRAQQSNPSIVYGDELVLKAYRRVEPGTNPELELLRFLTHHDFANIA